MREPCVQFVQRDVNGEKPNVRLRKCLCCWREIESIGPGIAFANSAARRTSVHTRCEPLSRSLAF